MTATYLLFANNAQSQEDPRGLKAELVPAETTVMLPAGGVVYDLFNGGEVPVKDGKARLRLAAGDGACWVQVLSRRHESPRKIYGYEARCRGV